MPLLDFDSLVICNDDRDARTLKRTLDHFSELGIRNFIVTFPLDITDPYPTAKASFRNFKNLLASIKPRGVKIKLAYNVHFNPHVAHNPYMSKYRFNKSNRVFIQAPLFINDTWFSPDINYFLYKQKLLPIFTRFERTFISCDNEFSTKLYKIQKGIVCIDINYMTSLSGYKFIRYGIFNNCTFVPCISNNITNYMSEIKQFQNLKERLGNKRYLIFCKTLNENCKSLFMS